VRLALQIPVPAAAAPVQPQRTAEAIA